MGLRVAKFVMKQLEAANHVVELFGKKHFCTYGYFAPPAALHENFCSRLRTWGSFLSPSLNPLCLLSLMFLNSAQEAVLLQVGPHDAAVNFSMY